MKTGSVNIIVIYDEYRSSVHRFPYVNSRYCPETLKTNQVLHNILNDDTKSDDEKMNKMKEIVSSMKSTEELMELLGDKDRDGCTPLHVAAYHDSEKCCEFLIRWGSNVNERNNLLYSPLFYATFGDALKSARVLLRHGANPKARAYMDQHKTRSWICFHYAQFMKRLDMLMLIFNFHTDVIACTLNVGEEKFNPLLFSLDPAVMKSCLLMYRKYCYDSEMTLAHCGTCGERSMHILRCGGCLSKTYCGRNCQMTDLRHIQDCYEDDFSVFGNSVQNEKESRIRHLVHDFYGSDFFPAFILMTTPYPSVIFLGFGRLLLVRVPPAVMAGQVKRRLKNNAVIPVWAHLLSPSLKAGDMKLYMRKSMPGSGNVKSDNQDLYTFLQDSM